MKLEIDDSLTGHKRKIQLEYLSLEYAIVKFVGNREKVAEWLGLSLKTVQNRLDKYPSLHQRSVSLKNNHNSIRMSETRNLRNKLN